VPGFTYSQWTWVNPKPSPDWYIAMNFIDTARGFALGSYGTLIKTNDGGITWAEAIPHNIPKSYCTDMIFMDQNHGLITGAGGLILRTTDGGLSWTRISSGTANDLRSLDMINDSLGFITGNQGTLLKTRDSRISWKQMPMMTMTNFTDVCFLDSLNGFIVANKFLLKTADSGLIWDTILQSDTIWSFYKITAVTDSIIFVAGGHGTLFKSTDSGKNCNRIPTGTDKNLNTVCFVNPKVGYLAGANGTLLKTDDSGTNWIQVLTSFPFDFYGISFVNESTGFIYGANGAIFRTQNGGGTCTAFTFTTLSDLNSVAFPTELTGYACGSGGTVVMTSDGGRTWTTLTSGTAQKLNSIFMVNQNLGFAVGENGTIIKTTDGGKSWINLISPEGTTWYATYFQNELKGFLVGATSLIYRTTDGGISWISTPTGVNTVFRSVSFSGEAGFICGDHGVIMKTNDDGDSWSFVIVEELIEASLNRVFCLNPQYSFIIGNRISLNTNIMYFGKTLDQGQSWTIKTFDFFSFTFLINLFFTDDLTGYLTGTGFIWKTINGGISWIDQTPAILSSGPSSVIFTNDQTGIAVGNMGQILMTMNGGGLGTPEPPNNKIQLMEQNFPNPFNKSTVIRWYLKERSKVELKVFGYMGDEIATLIDSDLTEGVHSVMFTPVNLSSGVYFYQLRVNRTIETRKLVYINE